MRYAAGVVRIRWSGWRLCRSGFVVLSLAGCRDVLGTGGWKIGESDAAIHDASVASHDTGAVSPARTSEASVSSTPDARPISQPPYNGKYGVSYLIAACGRCTEGECGAELDACSDDPGCLRHAKCLAGCGDPVNDRCRVACNLGNRRTTAMSALMACSAQHCPYDCAAALTTYGDRGCTKCLNDLDQGSLLSQLSRSAAALELESCQQDCPPQYQDQCLCSDVYRFGKKSSVAGAATQSLADASTDSGRSRSFNAVPDAAWDAGNAASVLSALKAAAAKECGTYCVGQDWSCLDFLQPPPDPAPLKEFDLHVGAVDVETLKPLVGARVAACTGVDAECSIGRALPQTVQADGFATLRMTRTTARTFFSAIDVTWDDADGGDPSSVLLYFYPPLTRSPSWTWRRFVSRTVANASVSALQLTNHWEIDGGIVWSVATCNGQPGENVTAILQTPEHFTAKSKESDSTPYYTDVNWILSPAFTSTSASGIGAFVNVPQGTWVLTLSTPGHVGTVGVYQVYARTGTITTLSLGPYRDPNLPVPQ